MGTARNCLLVSVGVVSLLSPVAVADEKPKSRSFQFTYAVTIKELPPGEMVRVWLPVPPSNEQQDVTMEPNVLVKKLPVEGKISTEPEYGNRILYIEGRP